MSLSAKNNLLSKQKSIDLDNKCYCQNEADLWKIHFGTNFVNVAAGIVVSRICSWRELTTKIPQAVPARISCWVCSSRRPMPKSSIGRCVSSPYNPAHHLKLSGPICGLLNKARNSLRVNSHIAGFIPFQYRTAFIKKNLRFFCSKNTYSAKAFHKFLPQIMF